MNKLKSIFVREDSVRGATWILVVTLLLSNILGLIRDHYLAQKIETSLLDTYYAAFRIPDLIFNLIILGAVSSAFIPVFSGYLARKEKKEAFYLANDAITVSITFLIILAIILFWLMPYLVPLIVPKFTADKLATTIQLARALLLSPIFFGLSYLVSGVLNSFKRFFVYSLAPLIYNFSIILATVYFADRYSVYAVVWGVIIGAFLHFVIQLPTAYQLGFRFHFIFDLANQALRRVGKLMVPRSLALGAQQFLLFIFTGIASVLGGGAVAIYNLADNIQTVPTAVFGNSVATSLFPSLSEKASTNQRKEFGEMMIKGLRSILYILVPASVGVILLRVEIVRLILGSGHFGWEQTVKTGNTLGFFGLSLVFSGTIPLLARGFYAFKDTLTPAIYLLFGFITSGLLAFPLSKLFDVSGLAFAFSIGSFLTAIFLYFVLKKKVRVWREKELLKFLINIVFAALVVVVFIQLTKLGTSLFLGELDRFWKVLVRTATALVVGLAVYLGLTRLLKVEEAFNFDFWKRIQARFNGRNS